VFAAMVESMDAAIGRILRALDEEGAARDTIVLFFSDNGGPTGAGARNGALRGGKATTWEGGLRVPAVLRWPGRLKAGGVSRQMTTVMDVFPTLAAAAGVKPRNRLPFDGENLWPQILSGAAKPREEQFFSVEAGNGISLALFHREWKLVRQIPRQGPPADHLYRIEEDPGEKNDLAARYPEVVKDLAARAERWRRFHPTGGVRHVELSDQPKGWKAPPQWAEAAQP
jgi:arylsulfatase A-like enzyme